MIDGAAYVRSQVLAWPERVLQAHVLDLAAALGWTHRYHTHDSRGSQAGFPDLVLCHPGEGRIVFAELKAMRGKMTPQQDMWLWALGKAQSDGTVRVCEWRPCCWLSGEVEAVLR